MATPICERAISEALRVGSAILKHISPNDVGVTGGHQCGYYLPKPVWQAFTKFPPTKGQNHESTVKVLWWQIGIETESRIKWYGKGTRSEYRMTRFGKDFPFLNADVVGDLLLLVPETLEVFHAFVLDQDEDVDEIQGALGVEIIKSWAAYWNGEPFPEFGTPESEHDCLAKRLRRFAATLEDFPSGQEFSQLTWSALQECAPQFASLRSDVALMRCMEVEYDLFRMAERKICTPVVLRAFRDVDDFLKTASGIMNRRKSRAGRALENHFEFLLRRAEIPHVMRPRVDGKPDVIIPSEAAYRDSTYPLSKLFVVGVKTTCKDRWRQVVNEAKRVKSKHILTTQNGISNKQLAEMKQCDVFS